MRKGDAAKGSGEALGNSGQGEASPSYLCPYEALALLRHEVQDDGSWGA